MEKIIQLNSNIRVSGMEQAIVYAAILIQYANESHQDFD